MPGFTTPPAPPSKAERLRQKTLLLRSGDLSLAAFLEFLDQQQTQCDRLLDQVEDDQFDSDALAEMAEELQAGRRGILTYMQGLESLRSWTQSRQEEDMKRGLALAVQADALVYQAVQLNYRTYRTHLETAREFLQQMGYQAD